jgi:predicted ATPase
LTHDLARTQGSPRSLLGDCHSGIGATPIRLAGRPTRHSSARQLRHLHTLAYALLIIGQAAISARNTAKAEELANELAALSDENRFAFFSGFGQIFQGWALAQRGHGRASVRRIREGLSAAEATGWSSHEPGFLGLLAEALARTSAIDDGLTILAEALATAEESGARGADAELHRLRGELLRRLPSPDSTDVEGCFRTALVVAREQGTHSYELLAAVSLTRLLSEQARRAEARDLLASVYGWFTEGFDTPDLKDAKALLDALA